LSPIPHLQPAPNPFWHLPFVFWCLKFEVWSLDVDS
jgi:hypothetical protein